MAFSSYIISHSTWRIYCKLWWLSHSSLRHRRTCFWVAADSVPLRLIRAIFPGTLRDMLYQAHSKDNRSKNQRGGEKKKKDSNPTDQLIFTPCLSCGSQAPKGGWALGRKCSACLQQWRFKASSRSTPPLTWHPRWEQMQRANTIRLVCHCL